MNDRYIGRVRVIHRRGKPFLAVLHDDGDIGEYALVLAFCSAYTDRPYLVYTDTESKLDPVVHAAELLGDELWAVDDAREVALVNVILAEASRIIDEMGSLGESEAAFDPFALAAFEERLCRAVERRLADEAML